MRDVSRWFIEALDGVYARARAGSAYGVWAPAAHSTLTTQLFVRLAPCLLKHTRSAL